MEPLATALAKAFPDLAGLERELARDPLRFLRVVKTRAITRTWDPVERALMDKALGGVRKIRQDGAAAKLEPEERRATEALILLAGRCVLLVRNGDFQTDECSQQLDAHRARIRALLPSVGRIDTSQQRGCFYVGTGFVVKREGMVMTNRHVVEALGDGKELRLSCHVDFGHEHGGVTPGPQFPIGPALSVHPDPAVDLALVAVAPVSTTGESLPDPLPLAASGRDVQAGRDVYVIGYPGFDDRGMDTAGIATMVRMFGGVFFVKRLQPGKVTGVDDSGRRFFHDCPTLGGNSGSCVVDLESHQVVGLHCGGLYLERNMAVALWALRTDDWLQEFELDYR